MPYTKKTMKKSIKNITEHAESSEKAIEKYLAEMVEWAGGICLKFSSMTEAGYPDRLVVMPRGWTAWVELKSKGKRPTKLQAVRIDQLRALGQRVYVIDNRRGVADVIERYGKDCRVI